MGKIFKSKSMIELQEELNEFASHHQNKGGQEAHRVIVHHRDLIQKDEEYQNTTDPYKAGYQHAITDVLSILYKKFVP